jgi:putative hydrolase of the HAD superfamily
VIRMVTLDVWGTLLLDGPAADERYKGPRLSGMQQVLRAAGLEISAAALDRAYEHSNKRLAHIWKSERDIPVKQHLMALLQAADPSLPACVEPLLIEALIDAYTRPLLRVPPALDDGAVAAVTTLAAYGYIVGVISNVMRTPGRGLRHLLERTGIEPLLAVTTFSDECAIRKPDPRIFRLTLRKVGVAPAEAVHVGDDPILDVQGAKAAGMRVIQVTDRRSSADGTRPDRVITRLRELPSAVLSLDPRAGALSDRLGRPRPLAAVLRK